MLSHQEIFYCGMLLRHIGQKEQRQVVDNVNRSLLELELWRNRQKVQSWRHTDDSKYETWERIGRSRTSSLVSPSASSL